MPSQEAPPTIQDAVGFHEYRRLAAKLKAALRDLEAGNKMILNEPRKVITKRTLYKLEKSREAAAWIAGFHDEIFKALDPRVKHPKAGPFPKTGPERQAAPRP